MKGELKKEQIGFTQISNKILNDANLSLRAKGLYAFLYSKPDGWDFSGDRIALQTKDGRKAIYSTLTELESNNYIERRKLNSGRVQYFLCLSPNALKGQQANSLKGKEVNRQSAETGSISNKDSIAIKNISNTTTEQSSEENKVIDVFYKTINPTINYQNKTTRKACRDLIKRFGLKETLRMAEQICSVQGKDRYTPTCTTPYQMQEKLAQFKIYFDKERNQTENSKPKIAFIS